MDFSVSESELLDVLSLEVLLFSLLELDELLLLLLDEDDDVDDDDDDERFFVFELLFLCIGGECVLSSGFSSVIDGSFVILGDSSNSGCGELGSTCGTESG